MKWWDWPVVIVAFAVGILICTTPEAKAHGVGKTVANHHRWERVHWCEGAWDANTGNGFYGGLQFDKGTWDSVKRNRPRISRYAYAHHAPPWVQIAAAELLRRQRGLGPWPTCGSKF